jgi:hypothetical protein
VVRRFANVLIWLALTTEMDGLIFGGKWSTPLTPVSTLLFRTFAYIVPWDVLVLIALGLAWTTGPRKRVEAVTTSMKISVGALFGTWLWGLLNGGSAYQSYYQLHTFVMGLFMTLLVMKTCRSTADVNSLGKVVVLACLYRALTCDVFYLLIAQYLPKEEELAALTDHCDSVLFVAGLFVLVVNALQRRTAAALFWLLLGAIPIVMAIVVNNRRLAWLGVGVGFVLIFILLPPGRPKRRLIWTLLALSPLLAAYVAAGWGNPKGIFKPVGSISTMFGENQDSSSMMRDIENYNLLKTLKANPIMGYGWGREYIEEISAIDISSIFPQYRYLPHNSLLGVVAFTGMLGFWGLWQMVVITVGLHARVYRAADSIVLRTSAMACMVTICIIMLQMWGDIGFNHQMVCVMLAITIGLAARLPVLGKLWPVPEVAPAATPSKA